MVAAVLTSNIVNNVQSCIYPIITEHYEFLVRVVYNVTFIQALCVLTCKFTEDEREAWKRSRNVRKWCLFNSSIAM